jgi:hypothetical protein
LRPRQRTGRRRRLASINTPLPWGLGNFAAKRSRGMPQGGRGKFLLNGVGATRQGPRRQGARQERLQWGEAVSPARNSCQRHSIERAPVERRNLRRRRARWQGDPGELRRAGWGREAFRQDGCRPEPHCPKFMDILPTGGDGPAFCSARWNGKPPPSGNALRRVVSSLYVPGPRRASAGSIKT